MAGKKEDLAVTVLDAIDFADEDDWSKLASLGIDPPTICLSCQNRLVLKTLDCKVGGDVEKVGDEEMWHTNNQTPLVEVCRSFVSVEKPFRPRNSG